MAMRIQDPNEPPLTVERAAKEYVFGDCVVPNMKGWITTYGVVVIDEKLLRKLWDKVFVHTVIVDPKFYDNYGPINDWLRRGEIKGDFMQTNIHFMFEDKADADLFKMLWGKKE